MKLGDLIKKLEKYPPNKLIKDSFAWPHSHRGNYFELAFQPCEDIGLDLMLSHVKDAVDTVYEGWKGGEFRMTKDTPCYIAVISAAGEELTWVKLGEMLGDSKKELIAAKILDEEYKIERGKWDDNVMTKMLQINNPGIPRHKYKYVNANGWKNLDDSMVQEDEGSLNNDFDYIKITDLIKLGLVKQQKNYTPLKSYLQETQRILKNKKNN